MTEAPALYWDVLCALDALSTPGAAGGAWSTLLEVADYLELDPATAAAALAQAVSGGRAEEHARHRGCFRLTTAGAAAVRDELFGAD